MKKNPIIFGLLLSVSSVSFAQKPMDCEELTDPAKRVETVTNRMKETLSLNDDQYQKVLSLNKTRAEKIKTKRDEMKAFNEAEKVDYANHLKEILNSEQYAKFQESVVERRKKVENHKKKKAKRY